jgi:hypothetical protein
MGGGLNQFGVSQLDVLANKSHRRKSVQGTINQLTTAPREYLSWQPCLYQVYSLSIRTSSANNQSRP